MTFKLLLDGTPVNKRNSPVASLYKSYMNPEIVGTIRFFDDLVLV